MRRSRNVLFSILPFLAAASLAAQEPERFSVAGNAVAVYNIAGAVSIEAGTGANVVVEVRRAGSDASQLRIDRREVDGRAALIVRYPEGDVVYRNSRWNGRTTMDVRDDGTFGGEGGRGDRVSIRSSGNGTEAHADLRVLVPAGKAVFLRLGVGAVSASNVNGALDIDVASAGVKTAGTRGNLIIDTGSGSVDVSNAEGDVSIDTGSGSVEVNGMRGQSLLIDTGSGGVSGSSITASTVRIDTGSGGIELAGVASSSLELDTGSGSVELDLTTDVERLRIDTGSGGVRLTVPENLGASIKVETGSGGISADVPLTVTRRGRDHLEARIGDGRGSIEIDTGSGGVTIRRR